MSLLQKSPIKETIFCKRDYDFRKSYNRSHPPATHRLCLTISRLFKLYVSFAKEPHKRDDILQKRPVILRSLLVVATPQQHIDCVLKIMAIIVFERNGNVCEHNSNTLILMFLNENQQLVVFLHFFFLLTSCVPPFQEDATGCLIFIGYFPQK